MYPKATTRLIALLGHPLEHSLSSPLHNVAYRKLAMDYLYIPIEVAKEHLASVICGLKAINCVGFNVTIPHKINILQYLDGLDPLAEKIGAVNTVCLHKTNQGKKAIGFNTDGIGFLQSLQKEGGISVENKSFLIFGAGGAARAVAITLAEYGAREIILCNRSREKAELLAKDICNCTLLKSEKTLQASVITQEDRQIEAAAQKSNVIINTTSCGMLPNITLPCPPHCITPHHLVVDIVYNPYTTPFLAAAEVRGAQVVRGWGMLLYQGVAAFDLFTNKKADIATIKVMKEELFRQLSANSF